MVGQAGVKIIAPQMVVAAGGEDFDDAITDLDDGHVKGTAAQVVDHDLLGCTMIQAVGQSR